MNKFLIAFLFSITGIVHNIIYSQDKTIKDSTSNEVTFEMLIDSNNMVFSRPKGYIEIPTIHNRQMHYEKAFKHPTERFEVRYAIRNHNFGWYRQMFEMTVLNISGGQLPEYTKFDTNAVKEEFNADAGCVVTVVPGKEFGQEYKFCTLVYLFKNGVGDGYIFYMADDNNLISELMDPIFYSLKFDD